MRIKSIPIMVAIFSFLMIFASSCSDESVVGSSQGKRGIPAEIQTFDPEMASTDDADKRIYVLAVDAEDRIVSVSACESVTYLDFLLSARQAEMIEAGEVVEITEEEIVNDIYSVVFGGPLGEEGVVAIGIISTEMDIYDVNNISNTSLGCLKKCALMPAAERDACFSACDDERDKDKNIIMGF